MNVSKFFMVSLLMISSVCFGNPEFIQELRLSLSLIIKESFAVTRIPAIKSEPQLRLALSLLTKESFARARIAAIESEMRSIRKSDRMRQVKTLYILRATAIAELDDMSDKQFECVKKFMKHMKLGKSLNTKDDAEQQIDEYTDNRVQELLNFNEEREMERLKKVHKETQEAFENMSEREFEEIKADALQLLLMIVGLKDINTIITDLNLFSKS